jgi:hypothetical protein
MSDDRYPYESWVNQALQGVLHRALRQLAAEGFAGDHHLFVSFDTNHKDVRIPGFLRAQYPDEITIVLQHQFEDLAVSDEAFQVSLSFSGQKHRLSVPFSAVRSFADPSVNFGLQVNQGAHQIQPPPGTATPARSRIPASDRPRELFGSAKPRVVEGEAEAQRSTGTESAKGRKAAPQVSTDDGDGAADGGTSGGGAEVIALDTFRKK